MNSKQKFGLFSAGIGAGVAGISLVTNTLDTPQIIASTILVVGGVLLYVFGAKEGYGDQRKGESISPTAAANEARDAQKDERKRKVLQLFDVQKEIRNSDVERLLDVSDATTTNYLQELEKEGELIQLGDTGRGVVYRKVING